MSASYLIIVISNDLADIQSDEPRTFEGIDLLIPKELDGEPGLEDIQGVEQPWVPHLELRIVDILAKLRPDRVRVAVHRKCLSKADVDEFRFFEGERSLRKKSGIADIQVLGFGHEIGTVAVWRVLFRMRSLIQELDSGDTSFQSAVEGLIAKLKDAFREWHMRGLKSRLGNCRSQVLGRLESIAQELQLLKEKREAGKATPQADVEKIMIHLDLAKEALKEYVEFLRLDDQVIFDRSQPPLDDLTRLLSDIPKISTPAVSMQDVLLSIREFRRWEEQLKLGFSKVEIEFSGQEDS